MHFRSQACAVTADCYADNPPAVYPSPFRAYVRLDEITDPPLNQWSGLLY